MGSPRPAVVVTAQVLLDQSPTVVQVIPVTSTVRGGRSEDFDTARSAWRPGALRNDVKYAS